MSLTIKLHISTANLYTFQARTKAAHFSNPFTSTVYRKKRSMSTNNKNGAIRSSLIDPDGGSLVELVVPETQRALKTSEAESLPKVRLTQIDLEWVHVISEGWASPLKGFMRENEYLQSLHFNSLRLGDGSVVNMSLPIVLAIDDEAKEGIGSSPHVGLVGPNGDLIGLLKRRTVPIPTSGVGNQVIETGRRNRQTSWRHRTPESAHSIGARELLLCKMSLHA